LNDNITKASTASVWTSNNVIDLSGTSYIDILTDLPLASNNNKNLNHGLLARVWVNADPFNKIFYSSETFTFVKLLSARLNGVRITLLDDRGYQLDLNGNDYSIALEVSDKNV
jgi:hypothetical protein